MTLYLHGLSYGEFFTNFELLPGYDFAAERARDGHVSVVAFSPLARKAAARATFECLTGAAEGEDFYVFSGATPQDVVSAHFFVRNADPVVVATTAAVRNRDPCGDVLSYNTAVDTNRQCRRDRRADVRADRRAGPDLSGAGFRGGSRMTC